MRLFSALAMVAVVVLPALAVCNKSHPSPENPTIVLGLVGGAVIMWRHLRAPGTK